MSEELKALKKTLGQLDVQRQSLEMESEAVVSELTSEPEGGGEPMGIDTPLIDQDGYPRGDVDIYRAKDLRHRLAVIRTDHKDLMNKIETILAQIAVVQNPNKLEEEKKELASRIAPKPKPKYDPVSGKWVVKNWDGTLAGVEGGGKRSFEDLDKAQSNATTLANSLTATSSNVAQPMEVDSSVSPPPPAVPTTPPFAKINAVSASSPAFQAGLKEGDLIVSFADINHTNHNNLRALAEVVTFAADEQSEIPIFLLRDKVGVRVKLVPRPWAGRGLIGCHIIPYDSGE